MINKKWTFLALALCLTLAACQKDEWTQVLLNDTELFEATASPQTDLSLAIGGGSGDYSAVIDAPEIADVRVIVPDAGFPILRIETKREGDAVITVTDTKSGLFARCALTVAKSRRSFAITSIEYGVDAAEKEAVLAGLEAGEPFPAGSRLLIDPFLTEDSMLEFEVGATGKWIVPDADGAKLSEETYTIEADEAEIEIPLTFPAHFFSLLPIDKPVIHHTAYRIGSGGTVYHMFVILKGGETGNSSKTHGYLAFYEELTEACKAEFPDAGVNAAVRAYVCDYWSNLD